MSMMPDFFPPSEQDPAVDAFLDDFARKTADFGVACEQYKRGEINIADITRHLSEATADAELAFSEKSHLMGMGQLQRYATIQKQLDNLTVQVFEAEIASNRQVILTALAQGDYFIINLTYNAIKSSIHMICAKHKIKTQQEQMLAEVQQELETAQTFIKVLKALEAVMQPESAQMDFARIQKSLGIYHEYFCKAEPSPLRQASDQRVFALFGAHLTALEQEQPAGWLPHLSACLKWLRQISAQPEHEALITRWTAQLASPPTKTRQAESAAASVSNTAPVQAAVPPSPPEPPPLPAPSENVSKPLSWQLAHLDGKLRMAQASEAPDFGAIEISLADIVATLKASGGPATNPAACQKVFSLLETYIDYLSNVAFGKNQRATARHISCFCRVIPPLAQNAYQNQMIETWSKLPTSLSILYPAPPQESDLSEADKADLQSMLQPFETFEALVGSPEANEVSYAQIEMALAQYHQSFERTSRFPMRSSLDQRVFGLFEKHVAFLQTARPQADPELDKAHILTCIESLEPLANERDLRTKLMTWRFWAES